MIFVDAFYQIEEISFSFLFFEFILSWNGVEYCEMLFLCLLRLSCGFCLFLSPFFRLHNLYQSIMFANSFVCQLKSAVEQLQWILMSVIVLFNSMISIWLFFYIIYIYWYSLFDEAPSSCLPFSTLSTLSFSSLIFVIAALKPSKANFCYLLFFLFMGNAFLFIMSQHFFVVANWTLSTIYCSK